MNASTVRADQNRLTAMNARQHSVALATLVGLLADLDEQGLVSSAWLRHAVHTSFQTAAGAR